MPTLVTASVDSIALTKQLNLDQDLKLSGQVVWTGRSALDIRMQVSQVRSLNDSVGDAVQWHQRKHIVCIAATAVSLRHNIVRCACEDVPDIPFGDQMESWQHSTGRVTIHMCRL